MTDISKAVNSWEERLDHLEKHGSHDQASHGPKGGRKGAPMGEHVPAPVFAAGDIGANFIDPATGDFTPERKALHDQIVNDVIGNTPASADPTMTMMGGGTAAGKGTVLGSGQVALPKDNVMIDADEMKKMLPETQAMMASGDSTWAAKSHEESSYLTKRTMAASAARDVNFTLDGTGDSGAASLDGKMSYARNKGYKVAAVYVTVPTSMAISRAQGRGEKTGRFVPESITRGTHAGVSKVFSHAANSVDTMTLWDTSAGGAGLLLASKPLGGSFSVKNKAGYDAFLAKGNE